MAFSVGGESAFSFKTFTCILAFASSERTFLIGFFLGFVALGFASFFLTFFTGFFGFALVSGVALVVLVVLVVLTVVTLALGFATVLVAVAYNREKEMTIGDSILDPFAPREALTR